MSAASSSTTGGRRRVRTPGIPSKCWLGGHHRDHLQKQSKPISPVLSVYLCGFTKGTSVYPLLENDNHVFKLVDEAFTDEIQQLDYQVRMLEEEFQILKATIRNEGDLREGPKIMPMIKISGGCVILTVVLVLGIMMYKK
ncbi:hypothetical protein Bca4012_037412 [Brassica carinata]